MGVINLAIAGDSTIQGTNGGSSLAQGGQGSSVDILIERLGLTPYGPVLGPGIQNLWHMSGQSSSVRWTKTGGWTLTVTTDIFDKWPFAFAYYGNAGSANILSFAKPSGWSRAIVGFAIYYVDYTNGGNWSYRIDGGAWVNSGAGLQDNRLKKLYVASGFSSTVEFRQADSSGTTAGLLLCAIEPYFIDPRGAASGIIGHNFGKDSNFFAAFTESSSGDELAWFDASKFDLLNGAPDHRPLIVGTQFTNDALFGVDGTLWSTYMTTIFNRVKSYAKYVHLGAFDQGNQTTFTTLTKQVDMATLNGAGTVTVADTSGWGAVGATAGAFSMTQNNKQYLVRFTSIVSSTVFGGCTAITEPTGVVFPTISVREDGRGYYMSLWRAAAKTFVAGNPGSYFFDTFEQWRDKGLYGWDVCAPFFNTNAAGAMNDLHLEQAGHIEQGERFYYYFRNNLMPTLLLKNSFLSGQSKVASTDIQEGLFVPATVAVAGVAAGVGSTAAPSQTILAGGIGISAGSGAANGSVPLVKPAAGASLGSGGAFGASMASGVSVPVATGSGQSLFGSLVVQLFPNRASGSGAAGDSTASISFTSPVSSGSGSAFNAAITTSPGITAFPGSSNGSGAALGASVKTVIGAAVAAASGAVLALDATALGANPEVVTLFRPTVGPVHKRFKVGARQRF